MDRRHEVTGAGIRDLGEALARLEEAEKGRPAWVRRVMREVIESQLADLRDELAELDARPDPPAALGAP